MDNFNKLPAFFIEFCTNTAGYSNSSTGFNFPFVHGLLLSQLSSAVNSFLQNSQFDTGNSNVDKSIHAKSQSLQ